MTEIFGVPMQALFGQLLLGLVNGSFYAMLSLGLAVIFGLLGVVGVAIERSLLKRLYKLDPLYGLLLTFGLALILQGVFQQYYGSSGQSYTAPDQLSGATNLGFMILPNY